MGRILLWFIASQLKSASGKSESDFEFFQNKNMFAHIPSLVYKKDCITLKCGITIQPYQKLYEN